MKKIILASILIFSFLPQFLFSQKSKGFDLDGGMFVSDLDQGLSFNLSGKYNYWFNPYFGYSVGAMFNHSSIDLMFESPVDKYSSYYIDDKNIINLSGIIGLKFSTPTYKGFGLMSDANFVFEPIPYNTISLDKRTFDTNSNLTDDKSKNKVVFTHFNPNFNIQISSFYEVKKDSKRMRFALGGGITNYNAYNTYYRAKVDHIRLKEHLKLRPCNISAMVFIRISGLDF